MSILSKISFIRRIMIGEALIDSHNKDSAIQVLLDDQKAESIFKKHFEDLAKTLEFDPHILSTRRTKIREYVTNHFQGKTIEEILSQTKSKFRNTDNFNEIEPKITPPIFIDYIDPGCLQAANCDLTLGEDVYVTTEKIPRKLNTMGQDGVVSIEPGEFGILMTYEYLYVPPDLMGFISVRLTHKQKGLVNISGFHVDPGFYGRLMFAVFNAGPNDVPLRYKERVFMIMLNELDTKSNAITRLQRGTWHGMENIPIGTLSGLRGTSVSVRNLDERIKKLEMVFPVVVGGVVSVVIAVITWILTHW